MNTLRTPPCHTALRLDRPEWRRKRYCPLLSVCKITTFSGLLQVKPPWNKRITMIFHVFFILHPLLPCQYVRQGLSALFPTFYRHCKTSALFVLPAFHSVPPILRQSPRKGVPEGGNTLRNGVHGNMKKQLFLGKYRILLFALNKTFANSSPCTIPYPESIPLFSPFRKKRQKSKKKHCCTMVKGRCNQTYRTPYYINIEWGVMQPRPWAVWNTGISRLCDDKKNSRDGFAFRSTTLPVPEKKFS